MADLMDMRWLVRDINHRAVDEVRIQHVFTPGLPDEIRREKIRRKRFAQAESHIPFYFLLDITYIWVSFMSVLVALIYFLMFFTLLGWTPSVMSFSETVVSKSGDSKHDDGHVHDMIMVKGYQTRIWAGYYLFMSILLSSVSWYSLFGAGIVGRRYIYIVSLVNHFVILIIEIFAVVYAITHLPEKCDTSVFRKDMFETFIWYGILAPHKNNHGHEAMNKMDVMQGSLACCGIDSYKDYEKLFATSGDPAFNLSWYPSEIHLLESYHVYDLNYYIQHGREIRQLPHSCCTPFWRQNVYCADDVFLIERAMTDTNIAKDRLNSRGCIQAVDEICKRLVHLLTSGMQSIVIFRICLYVIKLIVTGFTLRSMTLIMTTLFSVTRANVRFIYDYRITRPEEDPYKRALGDFRRGVVPEGWEEFVQNRIEGRKQIFPVSEQFTVGELTGNADDEEKVYREMIRQWQGPKAKAAGKEIYFGVEGPPDMKESEFLTLRGKEKEIRTTDNVFSRLARIGVDNRRDMKRREIDRPLKIKKFLKKPMSVSAVKLQPLFSSKEEKAKKSFKDDVGFVPIPEATSPDDKLIQEKQNQATGFGLLKEKFRKSVHSFLSFINFKPEEAQDIEEEEHEVREKPPVKATKKVARRPGTAPPDTRRRLIRQPSKTKILVRPRPPPETPESSDAEPKEHKPRRRSKSENKPKNEKQHKGRRMSSDTPDNGHREKVKPSDKGTKERRKSSDTQDNGHREKVKPSDKGTKKRRKSSDTPDKEHREKVKHSDKGTKVIKPKLKDVQHKVAESPEQNKERIKVIPKKRLETVKKPAKSKPKTYKPYEGSVELLNKKTKRGSVQDGKGNRKRKNSDVQEGPVNKRKKSLPITPDENKKKKNKEEKVVDRTKKPKRKRRPWNYGIKPKALKDYVK